MLKTTWSAKNLSLSIIEDTWIGSNGSADNKIVKKLLLMSKNLNKAINYLTPNPKQAFIQLKQVFSKAPIFQHFNPECYIRIETNVSS